MDTEHETTALKAYKAGDFDAALAAALELAKHNVRVGNNTMNGEAVPFMVRQAHHERNKLI